MRQRAATDRDGSRPPGRAHDGLPATRSSTTRASPEQFSHSPPVSMDVARLWRASVEGASEVVCGKLVHLLAAYAGEAVKGSLLPQLSFAQDDELLRRLVAGGSRLRLVDTTLLDAVTAEPAYEAGAARVPRMSDPLIDCPCRRAAYLAVDDDVRDGAGRKCAEAQLCAKRGRRVAFDDPGEKASASVGGNGATGSALGASRGLCSSSASMAEGTTTTVW
jgi:hypothetical protein